MLLLAGRKVEGENAPGHKKVLHRYGAERKVFPCLRSRGQGVQNCLIFPVRPPQGLLSFYTKKLFSICFYWGDWGVKWAVIPKSLVYGLPDVFAVIAANSLERLAM